MRCVIHAGDRVASAATGAHCVTKCPGPVPATAQKTSCKASPYVLSYAIWVCVGRDLG